jgi:hypothetical protein
MTDEGFLGAPLRDVRAAVLFPLLDLRSRYRLALVCSLLARELRPMLAREFAKEVSGSYTNTGVHPFRAPSELVSLRLDLDATGCGKMLFSVTKRGADGANVLTRRVASVRRETPSTFVAHFVLELVKGPSDESTVAVTSLDATALFMVEPPRRVALPGLRVRLSTVTLTLESSWGTFVFEKSSAEPSGSFADAVHAKETTAVRLERAAKEPSNLAASY